MKKVPLHGVLTEDTLYFITSMMQWVAIPTAITSMHSIGDIIALGTKYKLDRIWVHLSSQGYEALPDDFITSAIPAYNVTPQEFEKWAYYNGWCTSGEAGTRPNVGIGFTNHQRSDWNIPEEFTAKQAYSVFYYLEKLLGIPMQWGTGNVGQTLIRMCNTGERQAYLTPTTQDMSLFREVKGSQLSFKRKLAPEELRGKYVHCIDKNADYLGACTVPLGIGEYEHVKHPLFEKYKAGIWYVVIEGSSLYEGVHMPTITPLLTGDRRGWLYTPTVQLLIDMGYRVTCLEAYVWARRAKVLDTWCGLLSEAYYNIRKDTVEYPNSLVREVATEALKGVYVKAMSRMSHDGIYLSKNDINRPDWYDLILSESASKMIRNIVTFASQGYQPFMAFTDGLYYVTGTPTLEIQGIRMAGKVGHYKHAYTIPLEKCVDVIQSDTSASLTIASLKRIAKEL